MMGFESGFDFNGILSLDAEEFCLQKTIKLFL